MKEIEVKILEIDTKEFEIKLLNKGAILIFDDIIEGVYLNFPDFYSAKENKTLRIRKEGSETFLTMKEAVYPITNYKIREEIETKVEDFEAILNIFQRLGFSERIHIKKHRKTYELNNEAKFVIDTHLEDYDFIPPFVEIEVNKEELLDKYLNIVEIPKVKTVNYNVFEVIDYYKQKLG